MNTTAKWFLIVFAGLLVIAGAFGLYKVMGGGRISGDDRANFIQRFNQSCLAGIEKNDPTHTEISKETALAYCSCASESVADQMTTKDLVAFSATGSESKGFTEKVDSASRACRGLIK